MLQTKQSLRRKPSVGPLSAVGLAQAIAGAAVPFAQHRSQATAQPAIRAAQTRAVACSEVAVPPSQDRVGLGDDLAQAAPVGASAQRSQFVLQFLKALLSWPFLIPAKVPAQEVEALALDVDDARFGRMHGQSRFLAPLAQMPQRLLGFFFGPAQHDKVVRLTHHLP